MKLDNDTLKKLMQEGYLMVESSESMLKYIIRKQMVFSSNEDHFPKPVLFVNSFDRVKLTDHLINTVIVKGKEKYFYFTQHNILYKPVKIKLTWEDKDHFYPCLPISLTMEILDHAKILFAVRRSNKSFNGFDVLVSQDTIPETPISYTINSVDYQFVLES